MDMLGMNRREALKSIAATSGLLAFGADASDSMAMQLFKSLSDEQQAKICLPVDHQARYFISNWWYVCDDHRTNSTFNADQQDLIQRIFDSLHHPEHQAAVNKQVEIDQYGKEKNAPSVAFFGTPADKDFEFIYTGHHVTRRCNAHSDKGQGFGGAPIFYGHFPTKFRETKDHPGNPYWYQGKVFNEFVQALDGKQQAAALAATEPRRERSATVISMRGEDLPGLRCADLSSDQKELLLTTMGRMMAMFREDDVSATLKAVKARGVIDKLHLSYYGGKYDIGSDKVWDTWQIEGPEMVWYFRGYPHIHSYFHLKDV